MKEKILAAFKTLGFEMEQLEDYGYLFHYEGLAMLWLLNEDEDFLHICIPNVYEQDEDEDLLYYRLMDKINNTMKYVKANGANGHIWLSYERQIIGEENFEELLPNMIVALEHGYRLLSSSDEDTEASTEEDINQ